MRPFCSHSTFTTFIDRTTRQRQWRSRTITSAAAAVHSLTLLYLYIYIYILFTVCTTVKVTRIYPSGYFPPLLFIYLFFIRSSNRLDSLALSFLLILSHSVYEYIFNQQPRHVLSPAVVTLPSSTAWHPPYTTTSLLRYRYFKRLQCSDWSIQQLLNIIHIS